MVLFIFNDNYCFTTFQFTFILVTSTTFQGKIMEGFLQLTFIEKSCLKHEQLNTQDKQLDMFMLNWTVPVELPFS